MPPFPRRCRSRPRRRSRTPLFTPPLQTFFTVDNGFDFRQGAHHGAGRPGDLHREGDSRLGEFGPGAEPAARRGVPDDAGRDGRSTVGPPLEALKTTNRYRDLAVHPDGTRIYIVTDVSGRTSDATGAPTTNVANPAASWSSRSRGRSGRRRACARRTGRRGVGIETPAPIACIASKVG